jgi:methanogenesis imperfect marker protein 11
MFKIRMNEFFGRVLGDRVIAKKLKMYALIDEDSGLVEVVGRFIPEMAGALGPELTQVQDNPYLKNPLIVSREYMGNNFILRFREGAHEQELTPSYRFMATTLVEVKEDTVHLTMKGIGGAPAGIRLYMYGSTRHKIKEEGGVTYFDVEYPKYRKLAIGLDDTDSAAKGATYLTVYRIAKLLERSLKDVHFINLCLCINFPGNPYKTTNNASSAAVFAVRENSKDQLIRQFKRLAKKYSISNETGMAAREGVGVPNHLSSFTDNVRMRLVEVSHAMKAADLSGAMMFPITGSRGLIGALSAIGMTDRIKEGILPARA